MKVALIASSSKLEDPGLKTVLQTLESEAFPDDLKTSLVVMDKREDLKQILERISRDKFDRALICGGDGSLHCVVEAMMELPVESRTPLGIVPVGTANDFATSGGTLPIDLEKAVELAARLPIQKIDVGWVNGRPFVNVATGGAAAAYTTDVSPALKGFLGRFAYYLTAMTKAATVEGHTMTFSGPGWEMKEKCFTFAVGNGPTAGGGFRVAPDAKLDDGVLDLLIIPNQDLVSLTSLAAELWKEKPDLEGRLVHSLKVSRFTVECDEEIQLNLDGEPMRGKRFEFRVSRQALDLAVGQESLADAPH